MKNFKRNKFFSMNVNANVGFAGVGHNFSFGNNGNPNGNNNAGGNGNNNQNPMNPQNNQVPNNPQNNPNISKMIPGQNTNSRQDPNNPQFADQNNQEGPSPLDKFAGLFDDSKRKADKNLDANGKPINPPTDVLSASREDFSKLAAKMDFSKSISADNLAAIGKGGEDATKALGEILNSFGRDLTANVLSYSTGISKKAFESREGEMQNRVQETYRRQGAHDSTLAMDQVLKNSDVSPVIVGIQNKIADLHPTASPAELKTLTEEYIKNSFAPFFKQEDSKTDQQKQEDEPFDFMKFLSTSNDIK